MARQPRVGMRVIWRCGGAWERFFLLWPWLGFVAYFGLMTWSVVQARANPQDFERTGAVSVAYLLTIYPAAWAQESSATLAGLRDAGLEPRDLSDLKIEYLERYGSRGSNHVARRWAAGYVIIYSAWTAFALTVAVVVWPTPSVFIAIHVAFVVGLVVAFILRLRAFYSLAESRGYPFYRIAVRLRSQGLRR